MSIEIKHHEEVVSVINDSGFKCIAYLDLLGFSCYAKNEPHTAHNMLLDVNNIFQSMYINEKMTNTEFDAFEVFLPFSDSIFIVGSDANKLIESLSVLLIKWFWKTRNGDYMALNEYNQLTREFVTNEVERKPILFRGGISYGKVMQSKSNLAIWDGQPLNKSEFPNLYGRGVVSAVGLEKSGQGCTLFIDDRFNEQLNDENRKFVKATADGKAKYFLWQAFLSNWHSSSAYNIKLTHNWTAPFSQSPPPVDMKSFLEVVIRLYIENAGKCTEVKSHYEEFIKTTIESYIAGSRRFYPEDVQSLIDNVKSLCCEKLYSELFNRFVGYIM